MKLNPEQINAVSQWLSLNYGSLAASKFERDFERQKAKQTILERHIGIKDNIEREVFVADVMDMMREQLNEIEKEHKHTFTIDLNSDAMRKQYYENIKSLFAGGVKHIYLVDRDCFVCDADFKKLKQ